MVHTTQELIKIKKITGFFFFLSGHVYTTETGIQHCLNWGKSLE